MEVGGTYRIGELARRAGTHPRTIRYYESVGLVPEAERSGSNDRVYCDGVERLAVNRSVRSLGFALDDLGVNLRDLIARAVSAEDRRRHCALIEHRVSGRDGV